MFDLADGREVAAFQAADDTVNGVSFSPCLPLLATASGHRRYALLPRDSDSDSDGEQPGGSCGDADGGLRMSSCRPGGACNSLRLWRLQGEWVEAPAAAAAGDGDAAEQ